MKHTCKTLFLAVAILFLASCSDVKSQNALDANAYSKAISSTQNPQILDVRTPQEYVGGHLAGAVNVDVHRPDFLDGVAMLNKAKPVYVYCLAGSRSEQAANTLRKNGFSTVVNLKGGMLAWQKNNLPVSVDNPETNGHKPTSKSRVWTKAELDAATQAAPHVLVDFYAKWCGPCKKMEPHFAELEKEGKIKIIRVDVDANKDLANQYSVTEIPIILAYKAGKQILRMEGYQTTAMLKSAF